MLATLKGTLTLCGSIFGGGVVGAMIDEHTPVSLGGACIVGATVVGAAWWLNGRLTKIDDRLQTVETGNTEMKTAFEDFKKSLGN